MSQTKPEAPAPTQHRVIPVVKHPFEPGGDADDIERDSIREEDRQSRARSDPKTPANDWPECRTYPAADGVPARRADVCDCASCAALREERAAADGNDDPWRKWRGEPGDRFNEEPFHLPECGAWGDRSCTCGWQQVSGSYYEDKKQRAAQDALNSRLVVVPPEWFTTKPARNSWLLRDARTDKSVGVLRLGKVGALIAEGGAGKTMALVQLALCVATGDRWLGCLQVAPEGVGRVLLVLGEEDASEVHRRVYNAAQIHPSRVPEGSIVTLPLAGYPCAFLTAAQREAGWNAEPVESQFFVQVCAYLKANGPWKLIVIDPLSRFAGRDAEKDNAAATRFVQTCEHIAKITGATVIVAHHTNKLARGANSVVGTDASRGSTALTDGFRWVASIRGEPLPKGMTDLPEHLRDLATVEVTKSNYSHRGDPISLRREPTHGGALSLLDDVDRRTVEAARPNPKAAKAAERETDAEEKARRVTIRQELARSDRARQDADRRDAEDARALEILRINSPCNKGTFVASMASLATTCGEARALATLARLGKAVTEAKGANNATLLTLDESLLPAGVKR